MLALKLEWVWSKVVKREQRDTDKREQAKKYKSLNTHLLCLKKEGRRIGSCKVKHLFKPSVKREALKRMALFNCFALCL